AYGKPNTTSSVGNPYMFTGREYDPETGLYYYRARMYSPDLGRFLQTDPIGYWGGMNLCTYCDNNPANWLDPFGWCKGKGNKGISICFSCHYKIVQNRDRFI
ncbi:MAG: RHS repeat-associated core domain-containing protein, partial [Candidatus Omnitrophota bacterium]|nr:RHS repeat-associated core domain-containing protein [Candidatus Omnitrophota bacterium]